MVNITSWVLPFGTALETAVMPVLKGVVFSIRDGFLKVVSAAKTVGLALADVGAVTAAVLAALPRAVPNGCSLRGVGAHAVVDVSSWVLPAGADLSQPLPVLKDVAFALEGGFLKVGVDSSITGAKRWGVIAANMGAIWALVVDKYPGAVPNGCSLVRIKGHLKMRLAAAPLSVEQRRTAAISAAASARLLASAPTTMRLAATALVSTSAHAATSAATSSATSASVPVFYAHASSRTNSGYIQVPTKNQVAAWAKGANAKFRSSRPPSSAPVPPLPPLVRNSR